MTKRIMLSALVAFMLFACSGSDSEDSTINSGLASSSSRLKSSSSSATAIKKTKIYGVAHKGPFAEGSEVKIYELDSKYEKTKKSFSGKINSKGYFEIEIGKLASPYIIAEASGKYHNEVSGKQSDAPVTLNAVADVSDKDNVNINILTHLESDKVLTLAKGGKKFEDAKKEAQKDVLNSLGISEKEVRNSEDMSLFGGNASDSVLLVVSISLQGNRTTEQVSKLLDELEAGGTFDVKKDLASVDMSKVKTNLLGMEPAAQLPNIFPSTSGSGSGSGSSKGSGSGSGSGSASGSGGGTVTTPTPPPQTPSSSSVVIEPDPPSEPDGELTCGSFHYKSGVHSCEGGILISKCGGITYDPTTHFCTKSPNNPAIVELCGGKGYDTKNKSCIDGEIKEIDCSNFIDGTKRLHEGNRKAQFCDQRDGTKYVYVDIGEQTWMAENLRYRGEDGKMGRCAEGKQENCDKYGRLYTFDEMYCKDGCESLQWGVANPSEHAVNIACPAGWHLPSTTELEELLTYSDPNFGRGSDETGLGTNSSAVKLKVKGWGDGANAGTDEFGFSALPGGLCGSGCSDVTTGTMGVGSISFWWSHAYGNPVPLVKTWMIGEGAAVADAFQSFSTSAFYTRCLKGKSGSSSSVVLSSSSSSVPTQTGLIQGTPVTYGGETYETVVIGTQTWMARNLNYNADGSKCYGNNDSNCEKYGRLYDWATAMALSASCNTSSCASQIDEMHQGICPDGWHISSNAEWNALIKFINPACDTTKTSCTGGAKLKTINGWSFNGRPGNGTDDFGFSALPGGYSDNGSFADIGGDGDWWTATEINAQKAYSRNVNSSIDAVSKYNDTKASMMLSVRCVKNN